MNLAQSKGSVRHLVALALAALAVGPALVLATPIFRYIERPYLRELFAQPFKEKDQGMLLQEAALRWHDVISVYGSSELRNEMDKRPDELFKAKPQGFEVCPIGAAGNTTLMMAQKIASQGAAVKGQQVVCILSHTWFRRPEVPPDQFAGNFSPLQAVSLMLDPTLDESLRLRFEKRLLEYPKAVGKYPIINAALECCGKQGWAAREENMLLKPLLYADRAWLEFEDHVNTVEAIFKYELNRRRPWVERPRTAGWHRQIRAHEAEVTPEEKQVVQNLILPDNGPGDAAFLATMKDAKEWEDFTLLLDTLKSLGADALIISVPMPGPSLSRKGISRAARDQYYRRVEKLCTDRRIPVRTFSDHDLAVDFLEGSGTHLEVKGWLYVDELLDDFYHHRVKPGSMGSEAR